MQGGSAMTARIHAHLRPERARPAAEPDRRQQVRRRHEPGRGTSYARAEHALTVGPIPQWQASYDFAGAYLGAPPATNNLGSFSVNPTVSQDYIHLASWVDVNAPTAFNFYYLAYDAAEVQFAQPGQSPGPAWGGLMLR